MTNDALLALDAYWRAANYLTVGQIYLKENALLREPLRPEHVKPRLLGHWGTSPGLSLVYVHLNRLIREVDANVIYLAGPGHGGPAILANAYLEGTYTEVYPAVTRDAAGMQRLFRQFSTPGGVPSHVSVPTPGSIHEGGELGYVTVHAFGAAFDNPALLAVAVIGDGEAETGPLEGSWKGIHFLDPARDGAVLPILHLNGYKISGPTVLGRERDETIGSLLRGHGYDVHFVAGDDPPSVHRDLAATLDACWARIREIQDDARRRQVRMRASWPAIVLRTPKGWTGPKTVDGEPVEGTFRAHQVPLANVRQNPAHLAMLESWMRSYRPEELFDASGRLVPALAAPAPAGDRLTGRHGLFATYEAFAMVSASMTVQHTKWLAESIRLPWRRPIASLNVLLTSTCWRNDHNGFSHQGSGLIDTMLSKKGAVARIYLPPDANCLLSVADHCLRSRNYVNLIVIDKQPQLQWLDIDAARTHCGRGASVWSWASTDDGRDPDVVLAAAGDVPTLETVAAAWLIRKHAPELRVRLVNVVDLMTLFPPDVHPHGIDQQAFVDLFTADRPVVFAFHGYQRAIHEIVHGRPATDRFHVRGFNEQGTTTTPFDMVVLNGMSRYHLCIEALRRVQDTRAPKLVEACRDMLARHQRYVREHLEDMPEVRDWTWSEV